MTWDFIISLLSTAYIIPTEQLLASARILTSIVSTERRKDALHILIPCLSHSNGVSGREYDCGAGKGKRAEFETRFLSYIAHELDREL